MSRDSIITATRYRNLAIARDLEVFSVEPEDAAARAHLAGESGDQGKCGSRMEDDVVIQGGVLRTDLRHSYHLSKMTGMDVYLKMELNQVTVARIDRSLMDYCTADGLVQRARCSLRSHESDGRAEDEWSELTATRSPHASLVQVFAASAGNHALAMAYHGGLLGVKVTVCMPRCDRDARGS